MTVVMVGLTIVLVIVPPLVLMMINIAVQQKGRPWWNGLPQVSSSGAIRLRAATQHPGL